METNNSGGGLKAIYFTDLLLTKNEAFLKTGGHGEFISAPTEAMADANQLFELCVENLAQDSRIQFDGIMYRCSRIKTVGGQVFALRRPMAVIPKIDKLGYHQLLTNRLVSNSKTDGIQHGLVIFSGVTCSGKTTSAGALIAERLTKHGGLAVTIEDPPELPLQGVYGENGQGRCYQFADIAEFGGVAAAGAACLRFGSPDIIMFGEIRDAKAAWEAIRAALSGHLIVATIHGSSIPDTIERLLAFATETNGPAASSLLANGLACIIHQRLEGTGDKKLQLYAESLFMTDSTRSKIRERQTHTIETDIAQKKNQMLLTPRVNR